MTQIDWLPGPVRLSHEHTDVCPIKVEEQNESKSCWKKEKKRWIFAARSWLVNISWWSSSHAWVLARTWWLNGVFASLGHCCVFPLLQRLDKIWILSRPPFTDWFLTPALPPPHPPPPESRCVTRGCCAVFQTSCRWWCRRPSGTEDRDDCRVWMCPVSWMWAVLSDSVTHSGVYS